jgi:hypothetical protein
MAWSRHETLEELTFYPVPSVILYSQQKFTFMLRKVSPGGGVFHFSILIVRQDCCAIAMCSSFPRSMLWEGPCGQVPPGNYVCTG